MRYFYDCEFIEDGRTIDLISIGIVAEDGREFYAVSSDFDQPRLWANDWLREHVWPSLPTRPCAPGCRCTSKGAGHLDTDDPDVRTRAQIANAVRRFLLADDSEVSLWADYAAYDHVALAQLYGTMMDLPGGFPMFTSDIQQEAERLGIHAHHLPQQTEGEHNALADARHARDRWRFLSERPETAAALAHKERYRPVEPAGVLLDAETREPAKEFDPKRTYDYVEGLDFEPDLP